MAKKDKIFYNFFIKIFAVLKSSCIFEHRFDETL
jgi:hypothetical protein